MRDQDFDGLQDRPSALEDMRTAEGILNQIDKGERPSSGEMLFLRWYCGLTIEQPKNVRQIEMAVTGE